MEAILSQMHHKRKQLLVAGELVSSYERSSDAFRETVESFAVVVLICFHILIAELCAQNTTLYSGSPHAVHIIVNDCAGTALGKQR
jgi:hypothetical protein